LFFEQQFSDLYRVVTTTKYNLHPVRAIIALAPDISLESPLTTCTTDRGLSTSGSVSCQPPNKGKIKALKFRI
ncbi:MAG: hypothetical protein WA982_06430, partial [Rubrobacteraceae bacterium]